MSKTKSMVKSISLNILTTLTHQNIKVLLLLMMKMRLLSAMAMSRAINMMREDVSKPR
jgi:hypothetical protein